jgi:sporulation protein YlmC with PRC-barrel domain
MSPLEVSALPMVRALLATAVAATMAAGVPAQVLRAELGGDEPIVIASAAPQLQSLERYLQSNTLRASALLGMPVHNRGGQSLGTVKDIVVSNGIPSRGMSLIVAPADPASGAGVPAPVTLDEIHISADGNELYADASRGPEAREPIASSVALPADALPAPTRVAADRGPAAGSPGPGSLGTGDAPSSDRLVAALLGAEVLGSDGRPAAEIDDLLISTAGIDSLRVVLKVGAAGSGEKRIALPYEQLELARSGRGEQERGDTPVRVTMDLQTLQRQPAFQYELRTIAR